MIKDLLIKYNQPGPRYTSYPPANFFTQEFTENDYKRALKNSNGEKPESISLYFHVPFCSKMCHFCGCNTELLDNKSVLEKYFDALVKEIDTIGQTLSKSRSVTQIHWGGGTPNSVAFRFIEKVMKKTNVHFSVSENAEIAMECSPSNLSKDYINKLRGIGFNRISLGVQDFNEDVLNAVNRALPKYPIEEIVSDIRGAGFEGINIDLIYGLPLQTKESFLNTIKQTVKIKPDRIVTFSYAHVPWVKSAQKKLEVFGLPKPEEKLDMLLTGYKELLDSGYEAIGMDHFALPGDELAVAKRQKLLHRNFQGYCTKETTGQVYAFGSTGISQMQGAYSQNTKSTLQYIKLVSESGFAVERGYTLSKEEKIIKEMINEIMCNGVLDFNEFAKEQNTSADTIKKICNFDEKKLSKFISDGLMSYSNNKLIVTETGMMVVRNIAMSFDPNLTKNLNMYSKTI
ncbi:MAG: oxygen-independent coproporphyrinogen III oxidase [Bacteroidales bacterium]|nr:oxygen-independent coproporphyrinogen III oxidase [Bacteroidales bacterium]